MSFQSIYATEEDSSILFGDLIAPNASTGAGGEARQEYTIRYNVSRGLTVQDFFAFGLMMLIAAYFMIGAVVGLLWPLFVFGVW